MSKTTQGETITKPADIQRLLRAQKNNMIPVTLVFTQSRRSLTTYLIEVDAKAGRLILDEPLPRSMAGELASGATFNLEAEIDGVQIRALNLSAGAAPLEGGEPRFLCPIPSFVLSSQRRNSFRAQVRRSLQIAACVRNDDGQQANGWLRDMSVDGCGLQFKDDQRSAFSELGGRWAVRLTFPNQSHLEYRVIVQRIGFDDSVGVTDLGCQFDAMPAYVLTQIAALVTDLQRDHINFIKKGGKLEEIPARFVLATGEPPAVSLPPGDARPRRQPVPDRRRSVSTKPVVDEPNVDIETIWRNTLAALRKQRQNGRAEPIDDLSEALRRLTACWQRQRQSLTVFSRLRSIDNTEIEQHLASALLLADHQARSRDGSAEIFSQTVTLSVLKRLEASLKPMATLVATLDKLAFREVGGEVHYQPTVAFGSLHKQGKTQAELVRALIGTQGIYPLGAPVRLDNDCIGLVLRQSAGGQPLWVRQVYRLSEQSPLPPRDIRLEDNGLSVTGPADPIKAGLNVELLRPPLHR